MISSDAGLARTPVTRAPFWLTSAAVTVSEKILPSPSVPKILTDNCTAFRGSRRLPTSSVAYRRENQEL